MKEALLGLAKILERRDNVNKKFVKDTPEELQVAINTFFENCRMLVEYDLDFIPGEAVADLFEVLVKYPKYHSICGELLTILETDYNFKV